MIVASILVFSAWVLTMAFLATRASSYRIPLVIQDDPTASQESDLSFLRDWRYWALILFSMFAADAFGRIVELIWPGWGW